MKAYKKSGQSFSLIELLVVVSILFILISILSPSLRKMIKTANLTTCKVNLKQISVANHLYADEYNNWFVPIHGYLDGNMNNWKGFLSSLELYPIQDTAALCPTYSENSSYGMNQTTHGGSWRYTIDRPISRQLLEEPSLKVQGGDCTSSITYRYRANPEQSRGWVDNNENAWRSLAYRHDGRATVFYFDGHVELFEMAYYADLVDRFAYEENAIKPESTP